MIKLSCEVVALSQPMSGYSLPRSGAVLSELSTRTQLDRHDIINKRLADDKIAAKKILRTKSAITRVKTTWEDALAKKYQDLHPDWITRDEVF
jgi:hypothetical protein